jgi:hypothetical protein
LFHTYLRFPFLLGFSVETTEWVDMRKAVRMVSKQTFNPSDNLLFIFDVQQMPGVCGAWPAIWVSRPSSSLSISHFLAIF